MGWTIGKNGENKPIANESIMSQISISGEKGRWPMDA